MIVPTDTAIQTVLAAYIGDFYQTAQIYLFTHCCKLYFIRSFFKSLHPVRILLLKPGYERFPVQLNIHNLQFTLPAEV